MPRAPCAHCGSTEGQDHLCPAQNTQLIGQVLDGRYRIDGVLGQGGMGMVFRATQTSMGREVAVKTLHPTLAAAPQFFERFRREAEMASRLRHPGIITIYDFGRTQDGVCYYVMELLEGVSLKQLVKSNGPLSLRRAVDLVEQAARALAHAHQMGAIHRDLKPHNMMVQRLDERDFVKVLDFGLVKALEQDENEQLTSTGQVLGTPQYMPPEQAGGEHVDQRSDLYSLAGVLYFCLTGSSPFGANTVRKALQLSLTQQVPPVARKRQGAPVPPEIDAFFQKALAPEKPDRFQSAEEFIAAMGDAVAGLGARELDALPGPVDPSSAREGSGSSASAARPRGTVAGRRVGSGSQPSSASARPAGSGSVRSNVIVDSKLQEPRSPSRSGSGGPRAESARAEAPPQASSSSRTERKSLTPVLVAVPLLLVAIAVAGFIVFGGDDAPPAPVAVTQRPNAPVPLTATEPAVAVAPPSPTPAPVEPARVTPEPVAPSAPVDIVVAFTSQPAGADIYDGETWLGTTPADLRLERGEHQLSFKLAGHQTEARTVDFSRNAEDRITMAVTLRKNAPAPAAAQGPTRPSNTPKRPPQGQTEIPVFE